MAMYNKHKYNFFQVMNEEDSNNLKKDMLENGYDKRFPVVLFKGKVLDGWNRYITAIELKLEPSFIEFDGTDSEALAFSLRSNLNRRHLTSQQIAMLIIDNKKLYDSLVKEAEIKREEIKKQAEEKGETVNPNSIKTDEIIAEKMGTNVSYLNEAKKLKETGDKQAVNKVKKGESTFKKENKKPVIENQQHWLIVERTCDSIRKLSNSNSGKIKTEVVKEIEKVFKDYMGFISSWDKPTKECPKCDGTGFIEDLKCPYCENGFIGDLPEDFNLETVLA